MSGGPTLPTGDRGDLRDDVAALGLAKGIETSLLAKLKVGEKETLDAHSLDAFTHEVRALRGKKIPLEAADDLMEFAEQIVELLDDPESSSRRAERHVSHR